MPRSIRSIPLELVVIRPQIRRRALLHCRPIILCTRRYRTDAAAHTPVRHIIPLAQHNLLQHVLPHQSKSLLIYHRLLRYIILRQTLPISTDADTLYRRPRSLIIKQPDAHLARHVDVHLHLSHVARLVRYRQSPLPFPVTALPLHKVIHLDRPGRTIRDIPAQAYTPHTIRHGREINLGHLLLVIPQRQHRVIIMQTYRRLPSRRESTLRNHKLVKADIILLLQLLVHHQVRRRPLRKIHIHRMHRSTLIRPVCLIMLRRIRRPHLRMQSGHTPERGDHSRQKK